MSVIKKPLPNNDDHNIPNNSDIFKPYEVDDITKTKISPESLGDYGVEGTIDPVWDYIDHVDSLKEFHRYVAFLVFHARHLPPAAHANIAHMLLNPFKGSQGHPANTHLRQLIIEEISAGRIGNIWRNLNRSQRICEVMKMSGLDKLAAESAYDGAEEFYEQTTGVTVERPGRRPRRRKPGKPAI